jgi:RNA recognition motif-containing protein
VSAVIGVQTIVGLRDLRSIVEFSDKNNFMTKMMVRNLPPHTTVETLNGLFSEFGAVRSVSLATDIMTGRCGSFGFVHLDEQEPGAALLALNGRHIGDHILRVTFEQKRTSVRRDQDSP